VANVEAYDRAVAKLDGANVKKNLDNLPSTDRSGATSTDNPSGTPAFTSSSDGSPRLSSSGHTPPGTSASERTTTTRHTHARDHPAGITPT
jgi:hypothetical protein